MPYISKRVRSERREKKDVVRTGILILMLHFTRSMVLNEEQFHTVLLAIAEGLVPVPQERPPLPPKNPFEDMDDLLFESKFRFTKEEIVVLVT